MARLSVQSGDVRDLVDQSLVPLYLEVGSVAALAKHINSALPDGEAPVHQNRLHAVLSDDQGRSINSKSLESIKVALEKLGKRSESEKAADRIRLTEAANHVLSAAGGAAVDADELAGRLGMPPAVVRVALSFVNADRRVPAHQPLGVHPAGAVPDWSFQDQAVADSVAALLRRSGGNIGLVLPTGGGKTRTAFRIILEMLARSSCPTARVLWITHRRSLRAQARRELEKLLRQRPDALPEGAVELAKRVDFVMIGSAMASIAAEDQLALVVVDEAHHAAAASYAPVLDAPHPYPALLLTATPVRMDRLPIGIDEIAFTITYRELAERGVIITPEFEEFRVEDFTLSDDTVEDLVDFLAAETAERFTKTMVLVTRRDQMRLLYERLADAIDRNPDHPLQSTDIGFIDGSGNSHGLEEDDFLTLFAAKRRAVLISAQMLLEGYDDPTIDAVVITYRTESVVKLMQAAGRCVRYSPGKTKAWVVQASNPALAYRFDQRWLYLEIDDRLLPQLRDVTFSNTAEMTAACEALLTAHNVEPRLHAEAMEAVRGCDPEAPPRLLFYGLPYFGKAEDFEQDAKWGVFVETAENTAAFRGLFNEFSRMGADRANPGEFIDVLGPKLGLYPPNDGLRRQLIRVLTAAYFAQQELLGATGAPQDGRGYKRHHNTTWLRYITLRHRPMLPEHLSRFLSDCHNRGVLERAYISDPGAFSMAFKTQLPFGGYEGLLLSGDERSALDDWLQKLRDALRIVPPAEQLARLASFRALLVPPPIPLTHLERAERMLSDDGQALLTLDLEIQQEGTDHGRKEPH